MSRPLDDLVCREVVELVTAYLEGALPEDDRVRFEQHLVTCRGCELYLDQMRTTLRAVRETASEPEPVPVPDELLAAFRGFKRQAAEE